MTLEQYEVVYCIIGVLDTTQHRDSVCTPPGVVEAQGTSKGQGIYMVTADR